jgi:diguanylate cyclase (GGDEF)-like protein/PAS domain S-box-containing protein
MADCGGVRMNAYAGAPGPVLAGNEGQPLNPLKPNRHRRLSLTRHKRSLWALPAFGLLLIAVAWAVILQHLNSTERALIEAMTHDTEMLTAEFETYTRRAVSDANRTALLVKREFEQHDVLDLPGLISAGLVEGNGHVVVSVTDGKGNIVARSQPAPASNIADRESFRRHAARDTGVLDISNPIISRISGRATILLSRRLNHRDGSFAGIVLVAVTPEYFTEFYKEGDLGKDGSLGLLGLDGTYLARRVGEQATTDSDPNGQQLAARAATNSTGHYVARGDFGRVTRVVAYQKVTDHPFIVMVAKGVDEALGDFYQNRKAYLGIVTVATAMILGFFAIVTILAIRLQKHRGELKVQRRFLETLFDNVPAGITVRSMQPPTVGQYTVWNESNALIFGTKREDALGRTIRDVMPAENATQIAGLDRQLLASPMVQDVVQVRNVQGKGRRIYHLIRSPIFGTGGQVDYIMTSATDITEERARIDELSLASKVFETTADGIMVCDADDRVLMVNAAFSRLTGYDAREMVGLTLAESPFRPIDAAESAVRSERLQREGFVTGEVPRFRKDGSPLSLWITASCVRNADHTIRNYVRVFTDISLLKETQKKLEQLASVDTLTGLPNRRLVQDRLERAVLRAKRQQGRLAVMFMDLDGFKGVNDTFGHDVGDLLLREVARRLGTCVRASDTIGRFGGDEFAIVLEDADLPGDAVRIGERIMAAFAAPFILNGHRVRSTASIGIALYPQHGADAMTLLKNADVAMYKAKRAGRNGFEFVTDVREPAVAIL